MGQALCGKLEKMGELVTLDYNRMCCVLWRVCQGLRGGAGEGQKAGALVSSFSQFSCDINELRAVSCLRRRHTKSF